MNQLLSSFVGRPWLLFSTLLLGNALAMPYSGIRHDARLYAAQCLQAYDGRFSEDLFFVYGSQAKFSLFPVMLGQIVGRVGVDVPFLLIYLASLAALLGSIQRLMIRVFGDNAWTVFALLCVSVQAIPVGGLGIFHIQEPFLTARLPAAALCLVALERLLNQRWFSVIICLLAGFVLHPLVTMPAAVVVAVYAGCGVYSRHPAKTSFSVAMVCGAVLAAVLHIAPTKLFGHFDQEWQAAMDRLMRFPDPLLWQANDYVRISIAFAGVGLLVVRLNQPMQRRFLLAIVATALLGLLLASNTRWLEWALLYQGQPFRWVWLLELCRIPCLLLLARSYMNRNQPGDGFLAGALILLTLGLNGSEFTHVLGLATVILMAFLFSRYYGKYDAERESARCFFTIIFGCVLILALTEQQLTQTWRWKLTQGWDRLFNLAERGHVWLSLVGPLPWLLMISVNHWLLDKLQLSLKFRAIGCILIALVVQVGWFSICHSAWATQNFDAEYQDREFLRSYLAEHHKPGEQIVIHFPGSRLEANWLDLGVSVYFDTVQLGGQAFHRETAIEGRRRAHLVRSFDIAEVRRSGDLILSAELHRPARDNIYETGLDHPEPTPKELDRLLEEPKLSLVVLRQPLPGWHQTNGQIFIYRADKFNRK